MVLWRRRMFRNRMDRRYRIGVALWRGYWRINCFVCLRIDVGVESVVWKIQTLIGQLVDNVQEYLL